MKATDLRIGNLVNYLGEVQEVTGIDSEYVYLDTITFDYVEHDEIQPILLTEEWLLEFGFEPDEIYKNFNPFNLYRLECENGIVKLQIQPCNEISFYIDGDFIRSLKYIHELQNLYHAITGNELEIKE